MPDFVAGWSFNNSINNAFTWRHLGIVISPITSVDIFCEFPLLTNTGSRGSGPCCKFHEEMHVTISNNLMCVYFRFLILRLLKALQSLWRHVMTINHRNNNPVRIRGWCRKLIAAQHFSFWQLTEYFLFFFSHFSKKPNDRWTPDLE